MEMGPETTIDSNLNFYITPAPVVSQAGVIPLIPNILYRANKIGIGTL
jgi:hypothetical protein